MEQRGAVLARGARVHQAGVLNQQTLQRLLVTTHDRIHCRLEPCFTGVRAAQRFEVLRERCPAFETVESGDEELGVRERELGRIAALDEPVEPLQVAFEMSGDLTVRVPASSKFGERLGPADRPGVYDVRAARMTGLQEIFGELAVLLEVRPG